MSEGAYLEDSILMPGVRIGRGAVIRRAILDKNVVVPAGEKIGINADADRQRFSLSDTGIVTIGKGVSLTS